jgi:hypothetical protein
VYEGVQAASVPPASAPANSMVFLQVFSVIAAKRRTPQANSTRDGFNKNDMATLQETESGPDTAIWD